ncbi:MAG: hypothetical protein JWP37_3844 [Mucilaginibacter sp.]|nr:hypothetical protein [Mucilaginibacter sp.]
MDILINDERLCRFQVNKPFDQTGKENTINLRALAFIYL